MATYGNAQIIVGHGAVTITDAEGYEVAHWVEDEWTEDPTIVEDMVQAVALAAVHGLSALCARYPFYAKHHRGCRAQGQGGRWDLLDTPPV